MKVCPQCHGNNLNNWEKCAKCGMAFTAPSPAPVPTGPPPDRTEESTTPTRIVPPQSNDTTRAISSHLVLCVACGKAMGKTAETCPQCGEQSEWVKSWHRQQAANEARRVEYSRQVDSELIVWGIIAALFFIVCFACCLYST